MAELGAALRSAWSAFPEDRFVELATSGLEELEMKDRVSNVAKALLATMPDDFDRAAAVVRSGIGSTGLEGWIVFPVNDWVARAGMDSPGTALALLGELTSLWSAEFAVRPFIEKHPRTTFEQFDRWIESPDEHRRRLVSEGSRPRLPWGRQLRGLFADPKPTIALLDRLVDDSSAYVRKSVANHLNDISKDHPELAVDTAARWLEEAARPQVADHSADAGRRKWIASHGLRSLVKAGDPAALRLLGFDPDARVSLTGFMVAPRGIAVGEPVTIAFALTADEPTPVMVDYRVHHAGAVSTRSPKVFKLKRTVLEPGVETGFRREHRIREVSVRRIHPGPHLIELQVNGKILAAATVDVTG